MGDTTPCERVKSQIFTLIKGGQHNPFVDDILQDRASHGMHIDFSELLSSNELCITQWLQDIDVEARIDVHGNDDGDRDNIMKCEPFAKHFLRLCKMLPIWGSISCTIFNAPRLTGSSAPSESWFKNLKQMHRDQIPCSVDEFLKNDLKLTEAGVIEASRAYIRKKNEHDELRENTQSQNNVTSLTPNPVQQNNTDEIENHSDDSHANDDASRDDVSIGSLEDPKLASEKPKLADSKQKDCTACKNGDMPTGMHKCIVCKSNVHILDGCSVSIGNDEGSGEARKCMKCFANENESIEESRAQSTSQSQTVCEMNYKDKWQKKKPRAKSSKYMGTVPNFDLIEIHKKVKIGHLVNGSLSKTSYKVGKISICLENTCAVDSIIQLIAVSYAYNSTYRSFVDNNSDQIFEIAKLMAIK